MSPNLTPERVIAAYRAGAFPMGDERGRIAWYSPDPRCIIPLDAFHVPRTVRQAVTRNVFEIRVDTAFDQVIAACADRDEGTWITREIQSVYVQLHRRGLAHSVECWQEGTLAGGLYGVALGAAFFGESMFTRITNASKVALVHLVERLRRRGFILLDTQWLTPHLARFGAVEITRAAYLRRLADALARPRRFTGEVRTDNPRADGSHADGSVVDGSHAVGSHPDSSLTDDSPAENSTADDAS